MNDFVSREFGYSAALIAPLNKQDFLFFFRFFSSGFVITGLLLPQMHLSMPCLRNIYQHTLHNLPLLVKRISAFITRFSSRYDCGRSKSPSKL